MSAVSFDQFRPEVASKLMLDRIAYLERVLAYEARVIEAQTQDVKALGVGRKRTLAASSKAMRAVVLKGYDDRYSRASVYDELDRLRAGERAEVTDTDEG